MLEVEDTGVGISDELLTRVFDPFVQGHRAMDRGQAGLGLGLTVVQVLVRLHGGAVRARSAGPGKGSAFTVHLPRAAAPAARGSAPGTPHETIRRRIVLVEDNANAREMLRAALTLAGHDVHEAGDGQTGIDLTAVVSPEVVLVDLGLPGLNGYEVARAIRASPGGGSMRLVAITGYGQVESRRLAGLAGFDAYLIKPVSVTTLAELLAAGPPGPGSSGVFDPQARYG